MCDKAIKVLLVEDDEDDYVITREILAELEAERTWLVDILTHAPAFIASARGSEHIFELANDRFYDLVGGPRDIIGMTARELARARWSDALPSEQSALQHLLRAEAVFRRIEVSRGGRAGGPGRQGEDQGGGGEKRSAHGEASLWGCPA